MSFLYIYPNLSKSKTEQSNGYYKPIRPILQED
jgi:hypothetical protein